MVVGEQAWVIESLIITCVYGSILVFYNSQPGREFFSVNFSVKKSLGSRAIRLSRQRTENIRQLSEARSSFCYFSWEITHTLFLQPRPTLRTGDTMSKRSASPPPAQGTLIKRSRSSEPQNTAQLIISSSGKEREQALIRTVKRTSNLEAPIVSLSGAHGVSQDSLENAVVLFAMVDGRDRVKF